MECEATKRCSSCERDLPLAEFYAKKSGKFGRGTECRDCTKKRVAAMISARSEHFRAAAAERYRENRSERLAKRRKYYESNKEKCRRASLDAYRADPERRKDQFKEYYRSNADAFRARAKRWRANNQERAAEMRSKWRRLNPEKVRFSAAATEAKRRSAGGSVTGADIARIVTAQRFKCAICRTSVRSKRHVDHIHPLSRGGKNVPRNIQILCPGCNWRKNARDPIEHMRSLGRLL